MSKILLKSNVGVNVRVYVSTGYVSLVLVMVKTLPLIN